VDTLALLGLTTTDATGAGAAAVTVTLLLPVLPSLVAVIVTSRPRHPALVLSPTLWRAPHSTMPT